MAKTRLTIAKKDIVKLFDEAEKQVYTKSDIDQILRENRGFWRLAQSTTVQKFIEYLTKHTKMRQTKIELPHRPTNRYLWGEPTIYEMVQSLRPDGYFSHYTAMQLHGLTDQIPKTVYINSEQKLKGGDGELTQNGIDLAFRNRCRVTNNRTVWNEIEIVALNGRNTSNLGVEEVGVGKTQIRLTDLERTLIDATVRPIYSGGVSEVASAYANAHDRLSVNRLVSYLKKLQYTYPYHQAIGYYLERTGRYTATQISLLEQFEINFDFYLANAMKNPEYNEKWRLFIPKSL